MADINYISIKTAIRKLFSSGDSTRLEQLMKEGFDLNQLIKTRRNQFHLTEDLGYLLPDEEVDKQVVKAAFHQLILLGLDINYIDKSGKSMIINVAGKNYNESYAILLIREMITQGLDINYRQPNKEEGSKGKMGGWTALLMALEEEKEKIAEFLLEQGADPLCKNQEEEDAYTLALQKGYDNFIDLLEKKDIEPVKDTNYYLSLISKYQRDSDWYKIVDLYDDGIIDQLAPSKKLDLLVASAHQKEGDYEIALDLYKKAIGQYGLDNYFLNGILFCHIIDGDLDAALEVWNESKDYFDPAATMAANIASNMMYIFGHKDQPELAIEAFGPIMEELENSDIIEPGFLHYNMACMHAMMKNADAAYQALCISINKNYPKINLEEPDFDQLRNHSRFGWITKFRDNKGVFYEFLKKEDHTITIYTRDQDQFHVITNINDETKLELIKCETTYEIFDKACHRIESLLKDGYELAINSVEIQWLEAMNSLFHRIHKEQKEPIGKLNLEWDFNFNDDGFLSRPYYVYTDTNFELDHLDDLPYLPTESEFKRVMRQAVQLDSFQKIDRKDSFLIIQSEHDGGDEFYLVV